MYTLPEAEELLTLIAKDPEGRPAPDPFPAPYFFIDRFTLKRSSNLEIADGAMRRLAAAHNIPVAERIVLLEHPRDKAGVTACISDEDVLYIANPAGPRHAIFTYQRGRSLSVWSELEKLVKFLRDRGVTLYSVVAGELVEVKARNYLWMCNQAHDDHLVAVGKGTKGQDARKRTKRTGVTQDEEDEEEEEEELMARPAKKARVPRKKQQAKSVKDSGSISGETKGAVSGSKATGTKKKMARKNGRKGV